MDRKIKGLTLIEVLVVIAIIAIILAMATPWYLKWIKKYNIESDTHSIYSFLQEARNKAFVEKIKLDAKLYGNKLCIKCDRRDSYCKSLYSTGNIKCIKLHYKFSIKKKINITRRGTLEGGPIYYPRGNEAQYDCVRISDIRINMEKCDGSP